MNIATARLYETDFYGWIQTQANFLKAGNFAGLDLDNLIEEIESMGKSQQRALESRLEVLLMHLLKWEFQPKRRTPSWEYTIKEQRKRIARLLKKSPSLSSVLEEALLEAYEFAVSSASEETGLDEADFPQTLLWSIEEVMNPDFWPGPQKAV